MQQYIQTARGYVETHKKQFAIGTRVGVGVLVLGFLIAMFLYDNSSLKYTYQPVKACDLLTPSEAQDLLGDRVKSVDKNKPTIDTDVATSKCSYTDLNPDNMKLVALAVRSAVYDTGDQKNKSDFEEARSHNDVEVIKDLGSSAYVNRTNGQLNILDDHQWIILTYGLSTEPQSTPIEKLVEVARKILK
jgi:hypothetical protein